MFSLAKITPARSGHEQHPGSNDRLYHLPGHHSQLARNRLAHLQGNRIQKGHLRRPLIVFQISNAVPTTSPVQQTEAVPSQRESIFMLNIVFEM